ncbi:aldo/keto reductase [Peredibacter starrii]|uniref:Aldo/keto reductase n=1 Tax=Peredibacter starrii TaxID=28202 RepID=A0AAX4HME4_9BACT|nr:aldo/keto reductase [Peredibacter starrii]WPU64293.1 aldo/keto reductase [Peredibacter starrii]
MPLNHYVTLGKSGLKVSPLCLGTMTFGEDWGWGASVPECEKILARYIDLGGNFIDTANVYTYGHSEKIIGDFFRKDPFERQKMVIATKFFGTLKPGDPNAGGAGRKSIIHACEESLRRLQTDYIDLYWMHCWDYQTPIDETMRALDDLVSSGKVRYIGFSDTPAWKVAEAHVKSLFQGWVPVSAIQVEYSLLQRTVEGELIPMAQELGMGVTPWSPLKSGVLSGKYRRENKDHVEAGRGEWVTSSLDDHAYDVVEKVIQIAKEVKSTPAKVALKWVCSQPGVTSPIIGARTIEQLEDNLSALDVKLSAEHLKALDEISKPSLNFPADFLKRSPAFRNSNTTINGETGPSNPLAPADGQRPY